MRIAIAALLACLAWAPASAQPGPGTISTSATARTRLPNTVADVTVGIEAHARTIPALQSALSAGSDKLLAFLRKERVERLRTEQVSVTPETESVRTGPDRITGYRGRVRVSFRVEAERVGAVLGGVLEGGGNTLDSTNFIPRQEEMDAARQDMAEAAVKRALAQAVAVAEAAGQHLGAVRQIVVDPGFGLPRPVPMAAMSRMSAVSPASVAMEAGESEVAATVSVVVELQGR